MPPNAGYLLCATPRTGSTYLCDLLGSTGVLGRPESYFREADEGSWARRLGVGTSGDHAADYAAFVRAVLQSATTENGVFGARVMWGSIAPIAAGLRSDPDQRDIDILRRAFGPVDFVYLRRVDVVAQAVSWSRAEQTGHWHRGDVATREPEPDLTQMVAIHRTVQADNVAWQVWFEAQAVEPLEVTYEELVLDPRSTVERIADRVGTPAPGEWHPTSRHAKLGNELNDRWAELLREALVGQQS